VKKKYIEILKKSIGSVWFWFYKPETKKTKLKKIKPNRFEPVFIKKIELKSIGLN
jgi:hypothetical protein